MLTDECKHQNRFLEFRDQFPRKGEKFDPKSNGVWKVCMDCGYEWQDEYLTLMEQMVRRNVGLE